MKKAKFVWDANNILRAQLLAKEGYTASEAAEALGTTRSSLACRASRRKEFRFSPQKNGVKVDLAAFANAVKSARELLDREAPRPPEVVIPQKMAAPNSVMMVPVRANGRPTQPHVRRVNTLVEAPLSQKEKVRIFSDEGPGENSVVFSEMENHHCRYIVGKDEFMEAVVCGEKRVQGSPYCKRHIAVTTSKSQPRPIPASAAHSWDQSTKPVEVRKMTVSSLLKRSLSDTASSSLGKRRERSET